MRRLGFMLMLALAAMMPTTLHAQRDSDESRRAALQAYRDSLEAEVVEKFVGRLSRELDLSSSQRAAVHRVLSTGSQRRRELSEASRDLHNRLYRAVRDDDTPEAEFQRLLASHEALRRREHDLWAQDQRELASVLDPRQRAYFLLAWSRFQETLREIMSRRPGDRRDDDRHEHHP